MMIKRPYKFLLDLESIKPWLESPLEIFVEEKMD